MSRRISVALTLVALLVAGAECRAAHAGPDKSIPINHFIYVIQEKISYDHYFGTYPGGNGVPHGVKLGYLPDGTPQVAPFHLHSTSLPHYLNHSWQAAPPGLRPGEDR